MKIVRVLLVLLVPFLAVWVAFIATGFAFYPKNIFTSDVFWGFSAMYWIFICPIIFALIEADKN